MITKSQMDAISEAVSTVLLNLSPAEMREFVMSSYAELRQESLTLV